MEQYLIKIKGFSLIELMIALAINALLFSALITLFITNSDHYTRMINTNRLHEQLQSALELMTEEIRRAGYWANSANDIGLNQNNNPFMTAATDVAISPSNDCILFAYDHNNDGVLPAISSSIDDERYGFRLSNQTIQSRPPGATFACNAAASAWENITDPNFIQITNLNFTLTSTTLTTGPGAQGITLRSVDISVTGRLTSDNTITKTLTQHVRIRNDKFIP